MFICALIILLVAYIICCMIKANHDYNEAVKLLNEAVKLLEETQPEVVNIKTTKIG